MLSAQHMVGRGRLARHDLFSCSLVHCAPRHEYSSSCLLMMAYGLISAILEQLTGAMPQCEALSTLNPGLPEGECTASV